MAGEPYDTDRVLTLPNVLSFIRLLGVPLFLWLLLGPQADLIAVAVLAVGGFTDWLDGYLARKWSQRSRLGQVLDPIADRLYILATLVGLMIRDIIPWWLVAILVARDLLLLTLVPALRARGYTSLPVHFLGKAATFCLLYAFPLVLLGAADNAFGAVARVAGWAFALWGTGLYWWAGILYVGQTITMVRGTAQPELTTGEPADPAGGSAEPGAAAPEPAGSESAAPEPAPGPGAREPAASDPAAFEPGAPEPTASESAAPEATAPESAPVADDPRSTGRTGRIDRVDRTATNFESAQRP